VVNWYDGALGHYIGPHSDDTRDLVPGVPIVIVSLGESRVFRLRPRGGTPYRDFEAANGSIFLLPYATNLSWTHEVPRFRRHRGRRISVTLRALRNALARVD
jgi:alkylated DNA repair dioxygenase AlkB